jgi:hypothetical protein
MMLVLLFVERSVERDDAATRAAVLGLLTNSQPSTESQNNILGREVVRQLIAIHRQALSRPTRCYANSEAHRRSHRILTALLLLDDHMLVCSMHNVERLRLYGICSCN